MKRKDLVSGVKKLHPGLSTGVVEEVLGSVFSLIAKALSDKESVTIYNFGEWYLKRSKVTHVWDFKANRIVPFSGRFNIKFRACPKIQKEANRKEPTV